MNMAKDQEKENISQGEGEAIATTQEKGCESAAMAEGQERMGLRVGTVEVESIEFGE